MLKLLPHREQFWRERPAWEAARLSRLLSNITGSDVVFDIGAEEGDISAMIAQRCQPMGGVVLIEASDKFWPNIKATFDINDFKPIGCFAGFASNVTTQDAKFLTEWPVAASGTVATEIGFRHLNEEGKSFPQIRVDDIQPYPDVMNIDVEGAELMVLLGAEKTLRTYRPTVFVSIHPTFMLERYHQSKQELLEYMMTLGYSAEFLGADHEEHYAFWTPERGLL